jgi:hypothetical protein
MDGLEIDLWRLYWYIMVVKGQSTNRKAELLKKIWRE